MALSELPLHAAGMLVQEVNMNKWTVLRDYFGYESFREGQEELIDAVLSGQDALGVLPDGAGKSLCYQIPALMSEGTTLVISPMADRMEKRVRSLMKNGIRAVCINNSMTDIQILSSLNKVRTEGCRLIYLSPERLNSMLFLNFASGSDISVLALDEAHCISASGQDFCPFCRQIPSLLKRLKTRPVVCALTSAASAEVRRDIAESLQMKEPRVVIRGFDRPNLYFGVEETKKKEEYVRNYLNSREGSCGIIYCATRKNVDTLYKNLFADGYSVSRFHAGMSPDRRKSEMDAFLSGRRQTMVATNVFGMGIDRPDIRFVLHYNMPISLENYFQEAGMAGRDGNPADCILLFSKQDILIDRMLLRSSLNDSTFPQDILDKLRRGNEARLQSMISYCSRKNCLRETILNYFDEEGNADCSNCSVCSPELMPRLRDAADNKKVPISQGKKKKISRAENGEKEIENTRPESAEKETERTGAENGEKETERTGAESTEKEMGKTRTGSSEKKKEVTGMEGGEKGGEKNEEKELYEQLRLLRKEIASERKVPPYIVFSNRTLEDMCRRLPVTEEEMLEVNGVGDYKLEHYCPRFLEKIRSFKEAG